MLKRLTKSKNKGKANLDLDSEWEHGHIEPIFDADPPLYFLYPNAVLPGSTAPKTTRISGKFLFIFKRPEHLLAVSAQLTPTGKIVMCGFTDTATLPPISCTVPVKPGLYQPGEYEMPFYFDIPCYYWGRSSITDTDDRDDDRHLSAMYTIDLHIQRQLDNERTEVVLLKFPTQKQLDTMHSDRLGWRNLYQRRFFVLVPSPVDPGEAIPSLEQAIEEFAPQLGPIDMIFTSRAFTIGSLLTFTVKLPAIPTDCQLLEIRGALLAQCEWQSFRSDGPRLPDKPIKCPLFTLGPTSFERDLASGAVSASTYARLPNDRTIVPTSLKHTRSPVRSSHYLTFEFDVRDDTATTKRVTIKHPVQIASCLLISEQITLPTYGSNPVPRQILQPNRLEERHACACGFTMEQLMERENEGVASELTYRPPELKSPEHRACMTSLQPDL